MSYGNIESISGVIEIRQMGLFEHIISMENLYFAWKEFRRGKSKKTDVQEFELFLEENLFALHSLLHNKTYKTEYYVSFRVLDPKPRIIHKATVRDRVLYQAVYRVLYKFFDSGFISDSYASRRGKGVHKGLARLRVFLGKVSKNYRRKTFVLQCDVSKFFDSVDHDILFDILKRKISDVDCLWLLNLIINSFKKQPGKGLPLGNVTSQLFANIYLNELDQFVKSELNEKYYIRYCDDFIIVASEPNFEKIIRSIELFLDEHLKLTLHPNKIKVRKLEQGIDFLGYVERPHCRTLRTRTKRRLFCKINELNNNSYLGLLTHCNGYKIYKDAVKILNQLPY